MLSIATVPLATPAVNESYMKKKEKKKKQCSLHASSMHPSSFVAFHFEKLHDVFIHHKESVFCFFFSSFARSQLTYIVLGYPLITPHMSYYLVVPVKSECALPDHMRLSKQHFDFLFFTNLAILTCIVLKEIYE